MVVYLRIYIYRNNKLIRTLIIVNSLSVITEISLVNTAITQFCPLFKVFTMCKFQSHTIFVVICTFRESLTNCISNKCWMFNLMCRVWSAKRVHLINWARHKVQGEVYAPVPGGRRIVSIETRPAWPRRLSEFTAQTQTRRNLWPVLAAPAPQTHRNLRPVLAAPAPQLFADVFGRSCSHVIRGTVFLTWQSMISGCTDTGVWLGSPGAESSH